MNWRQVPVGLDADRWVTRRGCRTVLVVVHTVTSGQRLMDVVRLIGTDSRVQVVFTTAPDVFGAGVDDFLRAAGGIVVSWLQATQTKFDLALAAAYGSIEELHSPLIVLPHGAGYGKLAIGGPGILEGTRQPYGLDSQRLVRDGRVVPDAIVLPHEADLARLAETCPEAVAIANVAGDPCYDVLLASAHKRSAYRECLAVGEDRQLVVVSSTWGQRSSFGAGSALLGKLLTELPSDAFRVVALIHPNVWHGHGRWQIQAWLENCLSRGLALMPPESDWRAAMIAADWILADHGSLGVYGTAVNVPVMVTDSGTADLEPTSAQAMLAASAPQLHLSRPLLPQLCQAATAYTPTRYQHVTARITSEPGRFGNNMRRLMYQLLQLRRPVDTPAASTAASPFLVK